MNCPTCGHVMSDRLADMGYTTHINCDPPPVPADQLSFTLPVVVHRSDPETSTAAVPSADSRKSQMAALLEQVRKRPMTAEEAGREVGLDTYQAHRRMSDLKNTGQVRDSGMRRAGSSGRYAVVWTKP